MWDWVGGRTSVTSAVGLVPAALQGIDVRRVPRGRRGDGRAHAPRPSARRNPAALLALAWHAAGEGRGAKAMVVLPYKDRLLLFSRYLQQLVMESIGKEKDLAGRVVHQGLTVYGNKGSTDQHAFVQQLRDGTAELLRELRARAAGPRGPEPRGRAGRHERRLPRRASCSGRGGRSTRAAGPRSRSRSADARPAQPRDADRALRAGRGALRQPRGHQRLPPAGRRGGEEGGGARARAAAQGAWPRSSSAAAAGATCEELAAAAGAPDEVETVFHLLERLAANPERGVTRRPGRRRSTRPTRSSVARGLNADGRA